MVNKAFMAPRENYGDGYSERVGSCVRAGEAALAGASARVGSHSRVRSAALGILNDRAPGLALDRDDSSGLRELSIEPTILRCPLCLVACGRPAGFYSQARKCEVCIPFKTGARGAVSTSASRSAMTS
ncbi:MAG: hypothetical protein ACM3OF_08335, partial [Gemmatimonas sp.]